MKIWYNEAGQSLGCILQFEVGDEDAQERAMDFSIHLRGEPGVRLRNPGEELRKWCDDLKVDIHMRISADGNRHFAPHPTRPEISFFFQVPDLEKGVEIVEFLDVKVKELNSRSTLTETATINGIPLHVCLKEIAFKSRRKLIEIRQLVLTERRNTARLSDRYRAILTLADEGLSFLRT